MCKPEKPIANPSHEAKEGNLYDGDYQPLYGRLGQSF
jgi:hypothetical protein